MARCEECWLPSGADSNSEGPSNISSQGMLEAETSGLKKDLGSGPMLEQLLIQHAALCWLRLTLAELAYSNVVKGSITLTLGLYMEKRLTMAQKRFKRSCETLARVRKPSRNTPALQFNIATGGGQQVNVST